jgi:hypothetical protein
MLRLERLFEMQDEVLEEHIASSDLLKRTFSFLSDCAWLNTKILTSMRFEAEKQTAIRRLAVDSLSHTLVAIRLGLWGALPESMAILRSAIESCAQLQYVVKNKKYRTLLYELDRKLDRLSFEKCMAALGNLGKRIEKIHGRISETAAHSTASRLALTSYKYQGEFYDKVGFARNVENAELALFYCMDSCMMVLEAFLWAYEQDNLDVEWATSLDQLNTRFADIQQELLAEFAASGTRRNSE